MLTGYELIFHEQYQFKLCLWKAEKVSNNNFVFWFMYWSLYSACSGPPDFLTLLFRWMSWIILLHSSMTSLKFWVRSSNYSFTLSNFYFQSPVILLEYKGEFDERISSRMTVFGLFGKSSIFCPLVSLTMNLGLKVPLEDRESGVLLLYFFSLFCWLGCLFSFLIFVNFELK